MSQENPTSSKDFSLGIVLRSINQMPAVADLRARLQKQLPRSRIEAELSEGVLIDVSIDGTVLNIGLIDAPYPTKALEDAIQSSRMYPNAAEILTAHKCQLAVYLHNFNGTIIRKALLLTRVIAALCEDSASLGVCWSVPTTLINPKLFSEMAAICSFDNPPLYLWVDFRIGKNQDGSYGGYTNGVDTFGFKDFELRKTPMKPKDIDSLFTGFIGYLFENGDVLKDGDTIGFSAEQKIKIRYEPSKKFPGKTVYSLYD